MAQDAGSDLCHGGCRKLSGRLGFVNLFLLGTEILANMSKKGLKEQPDPGSPGITTDHDWCIAGLVA